MKFLQQMNQRTLEKLLIFCQRVASVANSGIEHSFANLLEAWGRLQDGMKIIFARVKIVIINFHVSNLFVLCQQTKTSK